MLTERNKIKVRIHGNCGQRKSACLYWVVRVGQKRQLLPDRRTDKAAKIEKKKKLLAAARMGEFAVCGSAFHLVWFDRGVIVT